MNRIVKLSLAVLLAGSPAAAQVTPEKMQEMERKIDALSAEVERLKIGEAAAQPVAEGEKPGEAPAASKVYRSKAQKVSIGGYGEMVYQNFDKKRNDASNATSRDQVDWLRAVLYAGYKYNDWILFNSELEFEHGTTGNTRGSVSVEMAYVDFKLHPMLGIRAGTVLVPMGLVNEIHEPTTFAPVRRPGVETNIIPSTWRENAVGLFGDVGAVSYRTYVMTGLQATSNTGVGGFAASSGLRGGRSSGASSYAEDLAWVSRLDVSPIEGVRAGGSFYVGQADQGLIHNSVPVTLWDVHAQAEYKGAELRAVYAEGYIGNADAINAAGSITTTSGNSVGSKLWGGYLEGSFNVLSLTDYKHQLSPFFRFERYDTQADTPDLWAKSGANSRTEYTAGVSYKPIPQVAVKADYQWMRNQARTGTNQWNLGLAYIF